MRFAPVTLVSLAECRVWWGRVKARDVTGRLVVDFVCLFEWILSLVFTGLVSCGDGRHLAGER